MFVPKVLFVHQALIIALKKVEMMRIIAPSTIIALLFLSLFAFAFTIQPAKAQSVTIYINPNGIITPSNANITTSDNVTYTFTGNNYLPIVVERSNIIINGKGHTLQAPGGTGFSLSGLSNVTIKNTTITNSFDGIDLYSCSGNVLSGNNVTANSIGIDLDSSSGNVLSGNNIANTGTGIWLHFSSNNSISGNDITESVNYGIYFEYSSGNSLSDNHVADSVSNFGFCGSSLSDFINSVDASNTVNGFPVIYWVNRRGATVPSDAGYVVLVNCTGIIAQNLNLSHNQQGIILAYTKNSTITKNNIANTGTGIWLHFSSNNSISGNDITESVNYGIYFEYSSGNVLSGNNVTANSGAGIALFSSSGNVLSGNNVTANSWGIVLSSSSGNTFYHNNFINNIQQVSSDGSPNTWDNGYPSGGNYWSDYRTRYPDAVENDSSAIWNTPYNVSSGNIDRYPLMGPFHTFGVGTWSRIAYSVDIVSNSTITNLSFNQPASTLTFYVTGTTGTVGFCRVAIPLSLMSGPWTVTVNGVPPLYLNITTYGNYTYIYFMYHHSTETVQITSVSVIPEFQPSTLLPLFMISTLVAALVLRKKRSVRTSSG
jgi:parallel beta-helix repeat protein